MGYTDTAEIIRKATGVQRITFRAEMIAGVIMSETWSTDYFEIGYKWDGCDLWSATVDGESSGPVTLTEALLFVGGQLVTHEDGPGLAIAIHIMGSEK